MFVLQKMMPLVMTSVDHHIAAAEHHEEAAEYHRQAAAQYAHGDYQQANEQARLAKNYGHQAEIECCMAMS